MGEFYKPSLVIDPSALERPRPLLKSKDLSKYFATEYEFWLDYVQGDQTTWQQSFEYCAFVARTGYPGYFNAEYGKWLTNNEQANAACLAVDAGQLRRIEGTQYAADNRVLRISERGQRSPDNTAPRGATVG